MKKVAGLLLAAGASTRMGRQKQLLPLGDITLLDHTIQQALASDLAHILLVLGHEAKKITKGLSSDLQHPKLGVIENKDYRKGISTSIKAGFKTLENAYDIANPFL